jgi:hypothetical protein
VAFFFLPPGILANDDTRHTVRHILRHNILCGDALTRETTDGKPVEFTEWSAVNGCLIKRRDFRLNHLLKANTEKSIQLDFFGEAGRYKRDETGIRLPLPVREFPPIHYRKLGDNE